MYDGVVQPWFLATFASATGLTALDYVILMPPIETCVERVATREGHGFTDEPATRKMHAEFNGASIAARHVFRDPPSVPTAVVDEVLARAEAGPLTYQP